MIPQRNISLLSNRLAAGGAARIREDVLERDYCLAWLLSALAQSDLRPVLAFKGGTALKRCYFADYRFSEDLDFTLREALPFEAIRVRLEPIYALVQDQSGIVFTFDRQDPRVRANTHTFYLRYTGPLPAGICRCQERGTNRQDLRVSHDHDLCMLAPEESGPSRRIIRCDPSAREGPFEPQNRPLRVRFNTAAA